MGKAFYRKYRSKKLSEIVGQDHITTVLDNALKAGKINHAYLFTGPRGVGKTSIARILAHEVNGMAYEEESSHLDIIEIDAASNRRIDEIRDLRDKVHIAPSSAKYKVYIIDEVHMLTREAFNALLKTLEEPPAHIIFILATTEAHKLPETIISRTQRFSFKPIKDSEAVGHLKNIAKKENIDADDEALELIAQHSEGSFRDSIGLLEQAGNISGKVEAATVRRLLGIAPSESIIRLGESLARGSPRQLVQLLDDLKHQGLTAANLAKQLGEQLRNELINQTSPLPAGEIASLLERLLAVPSSQRPDQYLEVILLQTIMSRAHNPVLSPDPAPPTDQPEPELEYDDFTPPKSVIQKQTEPKERSKPPVSPSVKRSADSKPSADKFAKETWPKILDDLKKSHSTLYGVLRMCQPAFSGGTLTLAFRFPFHQKQINEPSNRQKLSDIITQHHRGDFSIETIIGIDEPSRTKLETSPEKQPFETITNIFGGGEVLES